MHRQFRLSTFVLITIMICIMFLTSCTISRTADGTEDVDITCDYLFNEYSATLSKDGADVQLAKLSFPDSTDESSDVYAKLDTMEYVADKSWPLGYYIADRNMSLKYKLATDAQLTYMNNDNNKITIVNVHDFIKMTSADNNAGLDRYYNVYILDDKIRLILATDYTNEQK